MHINNNRKVSIIIFWLACAHGSYAADSLSRKVPQAVFVQISSQRNRIEGLTKDRKYPELEEVKNDAASVAAITKLDFKDNFHYCPVYYYADTNAERIKNRQFDGILMNADGTPVKNLQTGSNPKSYLIAIYGYPSADSASSGEPRGKGLVIYNNKFQQVGYFYKFGYQEALLGKKADKKYIYHSSHFDIDYFPFAKKFNDKLKDKGKLRN